MSKSEEDIGAIASGGSASFEEEKQEIDAPAATSTGSSDDVKPPPSGCNHIIGRKQNKSTLIDSDDESDKGGLIGDEPSTQESLHMNRPTDEELEKLSEKKARDEAFAVLEEADAIGAGKAPNEDEKPKDIKPAAVRGLRQRRSNKPDEAEAKKMAATSLAARPSMAETSAASGSRVEPTGLVTTGSMVQIHQQVENVARMPSNTNNDDTPSKEGVQTNTQTVTPGAVFMPQLTFQDAQNERNILQEDGNVNQVDSNNLQEDGNENQVSMVDESNTTLVVAELASEEDEKLRQENENLKKELQRINETAVSASFVETTCIPASLEGGDETENQQAAPFDVIEEEASGSPNKNMRNKRNIGIAFSIFALLLVVVVAAILSVTLRSEQEEIATENKTIQPGIQFPPDNTVVAQVPNTICYERIPLSGFSESCPPQELGSAVTNLVAISRLWNFRQADIAIINAGEVKTDIDPGNFTVSDAKSLMPYNNTIVMLQIPGKQLIVALERALQTLVEDYLLLELNETMTGGSYPYGAGIRFHVNMSQPFPNRLSRIEVNPQISQKVWHPIDVTQTYSVVTNSFLAGGGDGYQEFVLLPKETYNHTEIHTLSAFLEYCEDIQVLEEPPLEHFSTQRYDDH